MIMQEIQIVLKSINEVKKFVQTITQFDGEFEIVSGKYIVDAKSILGLFSVDLSKPVKLRMHIEGEMLENVLNAIEEYRTDKE